MLDTGRIGMNRFSDQLFACPGLASDEDCRTARRHLRDQPFPAVPGGARAAHPEPGDEPGGGGEGGEVEQDAVHRAARQQE